MIKQLIYDLLICEKAEELKNSGSSLCASVMI